MDIKNIYICIFTYWGPSRVDYLGIPSFSV